MTTDSKSYKEIEKIRKTILSAMAEMSKIIRNYENIVSRRVAYLPFDPDRSTTSANQNKLNAIKQTLEQIDELTNVIKKNAREVIWNEK